MKLLEIALLTFGVTLIALFVGAQAFGKAERQRDIPSVAEPIGAPVAAIVHTAWKMPGSSETYVVTGLSVVEPADLHVLANSSESLLRLVTCCPFDFVGTAPQRAIVRAVATGTPP